MGGGYDGSQDNPGYSTDSLGNTVLMLDAETGALLWSASPDSRPNNLQLPEMTNSIPARISVVDINAMTWQTVCTLVIWVVESGVLTSLTVKAQRKR